MNVADTAQHVGNSLKQTEETLLLGLVVGEVGDVGRLVVSAEAGSCALHGFGGTRPALGASPVEARTLAENRHRLLLLVPTGGIFLVRRQPTLLLRALNVGVIPRSSALHCGSRVT